MREFNLDNYVTVAERIQTFWVTYPEGRIVTTVESLDGPEVKNRMVVMQAKVYRSHKDTEPIATGWAKEREGTFGANKTAFLENAETSSLGRALANMGILVEKNRPSREEMLAVQRGEEEHQVVLEQIKSLVKNLNDADLIKETKTKWSELKENKIEAEDFLSYIMSNFDPQGVENET